MCAVATKTATQLKCVCHLWCKICFSACFSFFSFLLSWLLMDITFFHANMNSLTAVRKMWKDVERQNSDKILWIICCVEQWFMKKMEILKTVLWQKRYWCENAFDVPYFIFWLVRNASWMKSINFKCLTTAISVDCWRELRQCTLLRRKKKRVERIMCWKPSRTKSSKQKPRLIDETSL